MWKTESVLPRRGNLTGQKGEITVNADGTQAFVHDGETPGGFPLSGSGSGDSGASAAAAAASAAAAATSATNANTSAGAAASSATQAASSSASAATSATTATSGASAASASATNAATSATSASNAAIAAQAAATSIGAGSGGSSALATVAALTALTGTNLVNNQQYVVTNYAVIGDNGGGVFIWNSSSTAQPDGGVTFAPAGNLTTVTGESLGTGNGTLTTFSGTLAHIGLNPGSMTVTAGGATFTDDGAGNLLRSGMPSGTINYKTGAWTLTFAAAPTGAITAGYKYVNAAGRWIRQFDGLIYAQWFGADATGARDATAALQAADNYAFASLGSMCMQGQYRTSYTINLRGPYTTGYGNSGSDGANAGSSVTFYPVSNADLYPAFTSSATTGAISPIIEGLWVQSAGTAYSNNALADVTNTTALGDLSLYTTLAPYSAFAAGPVAFSQGAGQSAPRYRSCGSGRIKFGLVLDNLNGHILSDDCHWGGFCGVYCKTNAESYTFRNGSCTGQLAGVMLGDTLYVGHYGGISGATVFENIDFGFGPYCFFQVHDNPTPIPANTQTGGVSGVLFHSCGFEGVGEAAFRLLPTADFAPQFVSSYGPVSYNATYNVPPAFTMSKGHGTFWIWCGAFGDFRFDSFGALQGAWGYSTVPGVVQGIAIAQAQDNGTRLRAQEYLFLNGLVVVDATGTPRANAQLETARPNFVSRSTVLPEATKNVLTLRKDFLPQKNLLLNPEVPANWTIYSGGSTVSVGSYSSFAGALPALTSVPVDMMHELGLNPNVVKLNAGATSANWSGALPFAAGTPMVVPHPANVGFSFWLYVGVAPVVGVGQAVNCSNATQLYGFSTGARSSSGWVKVWGYGQNAFQNAGSGDDNYFNLSLGTDGNLGANNSIYIAGLMSFVDEIAPYNPYNGPTAGAPLGVSSFTAANLPNPANFPLGAMTYCTNGRNTGEGAGAGKGCPVFVKSITGVSTWCAIWSGVAVTT